MKLVLQTLVCSTLVSFSAGLTARQAPDILDVEVLLFLKAAMADRSRCVRVWGSCAGSPAAPKNLCKTARSATERILGQAPQRQRMRPSPRGGILAPTEEQGAARKRRTEWRSSWK